MTTDSDDREIEAKFDCDPPAHDALENLKSIDGFALADRQKRYQNDIYYDTSDSALVRAGMSLRLRVLKSEVRMTFKSERAPVDEPSEANIASRLEDEVKVPAEVIQGYDYIGALPEGIDLSPLRRARRVAPDGDLLPIARIENDRTLLDFVDERGDHVELAVDRCRGIRLRDGREVVFDGAELEVKNGGREVVVRLSAELMRAVDGLQPMSQTKLGRTLG